MPEDWASRDRAYVRGKGEVASGGGDKQQRQGGRSLKSVIAGGPNLDRNETGEYAEEARTFIAASSRKDIERYA